MQHYFVTTDHVTLGWILFGVVLFIYLMLCNKYLLSDRWYAKITTSTSGAAQGQSSDSDTKSTVNKTSNNIVNKGSFIATLVVTLIAVSIGPLLTSFYHNHPDEVMNVTIELEGQINEWAAQDRDKGDWQPVYPGADYEGKKAYQNSKGDVVELYLAHYAFQAEGKEAIHYSNKSYDENSWKTVSRRRLDQTLTNVSLAVDQRIVESSRGNKKLLWQWYYVNKRRLSGDVDAKLAGIQGILSGEPQITVLIVTVDMGQSYEQARAVLTSFLTESIDTIESAVDHVRLVEHADH